MDRDQRHDDELLRRSDAVGRLGDVRGDGQRARRRTGLHRRVQRPAHQAARLRLRGADEGTGGGEADHAGRALPARGRVVRPARGAALPHRGQLRVPVGLLPLHPEAQPDEERTPRQRGSAPDARRQGTAQRPPRGQPAQGCDLQGAVGRHRRPGPHLPLHAGADRADAQRHRAPARQRSGPGQGRRRVLAARGADLRQRRRLLHLDPGRR